MNDELLKIREEISSLKKDGEVVNLLVSRLDIALDKLTDVFTGISKIMAVHEIRLEQNEKTNESILKLSEERRKETKLELTILKEALTEKLDNHHHSHSESIKRIAERTSSLEKWKWYAIGIAGGGFFALTQLDKIFKLF